MSDTIRHAWTDHAKEAKFCHECGTALVVGAIRHKARMTELDAEHYDVIASCSCGWSKQCGTAAGARGPQGRPRAQDAIAEHLAKNLPGLRCPHEGDMP